MRIVISEIYKSITQPIDQILPDFTILSGINGAGKSHLLKAIEENIAKVFDDDGTLLSPVRYFNTNSINTNDSYQVGRESYSNEINSIHSNIQSFIQQRRAQSNITLENHFRYNNQSYLNVIKNILQGTGKSLEQIDLNDIKEFTPLYTNVVQDIFQQNFSAIFKRYSDAYDDNAYNEFLHNVKGKRKKFLSESEFIKKHGTPPWDFVNRIFSEGQIDYTINDPIEDERDFPYFFKLVNKVNGANVNFSDLSSGEKVLISLTLALYNTKLEVSFPKLLLLDEPDAPLHPSMAKQLLNVIKEVFVKEKNVKVIMTTHSPSTIAMADEESLYVMQKEKPRIQKRSQDQIMKLLTDGIPMFSIYADNRRQVFVESDIDALFYSKVYEKLKKKFQNDKSLYFISSGAITDSTGNCDKVRRIVNLLDEFGNKTIYGIIDWDKKNHGNSKVHVLGHNVRYSLENYIYDPIILSNFLLRELIVTKAYFNIDEELSLLDFRTYSQHTLQTIVDTLTYNIKAKLEEINFKDSSTTNIMYMNKVFLQIPNWYLQSNGHDLEKSIFKAFPKLIGKFKPKASADELSIDNHSKGSEVIASTGTKVKEEIINKVFEDLPEFITVDVFLLLQGLHI